MNTIVLKNQTFSYQIIRKPIRSLNLHLQSSSSFHVTCPYFTPLFQVNHFIRSHSSWILKNSQRIIVNAPLSRRHTITILGQPYQLVHQRFALPIINHSSNTISISSQSDFVSLLKPFSKTLIQKHLQILQQKYPFRFHRLSVRNQQTRFGSCSSLGNLNFNWQIIFFPLDKFHHLLWHEITHLEVKNHSGHFYLALSRHDPNWKSNRLWLKKEARKFFIV